jgi:single-strand DNA-binding protein
MLNRVSIIGNLGADPEIRTTQAGTKIANFRVATTQRWRDKAGAWQERTEWIPIVLINQFLINVAETRLFKGTKVFLEGEFQTRKYTDKAGVERYTTEVLIGNPGSTLEVFGGPTSGGQSGGPAPDPAPRTPPRQRTQQPLGNPKGPLGNPMGPEPPDYDDSDPLPF